MAEELGDVDAGMFVCERVHVSLAARNGQETGRVVWEPNLP